MASKCEVVLEREYEMRNDNESSSIELVDDENIKSICAHVSLFCRRSAENVVFN